jgi:hypothetical protein
LVTETEFGAFDCSMRKQRGRQPWRPFEFSTQEQRGRWEPSCLVVGIIRYAWLLGVRIAPVLVRPDRPLTQPLQRLSRLCLLC